MATLDFPPNPELYQIWTAPVGTVYVWNGTGWVIGYYDSETSKFTTIGGLFDQVRVLLQDTDLSGSQYRYSDDSLMMNLNQGLLEMYRIRPDIYLENKFRVPQYTIGDLSALIPIEQQYMPSLVYFIVGMAQLRDDEGTQDSRASSFLAKFTSTLVAVA